MPSVAEPITFAGGAIDRVAHRRADARWVAAARTDPRARAVVADRRGVLLEAPRTASAASPSGPDADGLAPRAVVDAWTPVHGEPRRPALVPLDDREPVLLGVTADGVPLWAVEAREDDAVTGLREAAPSLSGTDAGILAYVQSLLHWRRTHRFCGACGAPTEPQEAGHVRVCDAGHTAHPRTDPVVIMLVTDDAGGRVLLGRQPSWPPGRFSALAGFVEPGETLEAAVAREVREEVGVRVGEVRYRGSQPWPFPANLMLGFEAAWAEGDVSVDETELEDARWFTAAQLRAAVREAPDAPLRLPPAYAIARQLVERWLGDVA